MRRDVYQRATIRITHLPTGTVVVSEQQGNERLTQTKARAMSILISKLAFARYQTEPTEEVSVSVVDGMMDL